MPKQVDHQERRQQIAAAVCRLAAAHGLEGVSLRHVAAEAGVSMGRVQHYFKTKDEMLLFAFGTISEGVEQRVTQAFSALPQPPDARSLVRALLIEMMPIGDHAKAEMPMWVAFFARAVVEPQMAELLRQGTRSLHGFVAEQIGNARPASDSCDAAREADILLSLTDGLMMRLMVGGIDAETALAALDHQLDRAFGT
ncbi:TetR/AcrR family transcriptional regulator [Nocardia suismassiliense]|uniref:TetR/AcrR family transcriptional regulator n=1 Tax=Nocardia suismassiliense TaxID=2077092 RepID=UPI000D1E37F9|nr:TetR family transcriptional regulator C-terminal domain-containing protein [Nocardia suismassiliense]